MKKRFSGRQWFLMLFLIAGLSVVPLLRPWAWSSLKKVEATRQDGGQISTADLAKLQSPEEVDAYLASLNDQQARQLLAVTLKQEIAAKQSKSRKSSAGSEGFIGPLFFAGQEAATSAFQHMTVILEHMNSGQFSWSGVVRKLSQGGSAGQLFLTLVICAVLIGCGIAGERLILRFTSDIRHQLMAGIALGRWQRMGRILSRFLLDALGILTYVAVTFILFVLIFHKGEAGSMVASSCLIASYYFRLIHWAAKVVFAPAAPSLRLFPMADDTAIFLYRWVITISAVAIIIVAAGYLFHEVGLGQDLFTLMYLAAGLSVTLLLVVMIWQARSRVAAVIQSEDPGNLAGLRAKFAATWHLFAIIIVIVVGLMWEVQVLQRGNVNILRLLYSLFLIPLFIGIDQGVQRLLLMTSGEGREMIDLSGEEGTPAEATAPPTIEGELHYYIPLIRRAFRGILLLFLFFVVLRMWGVDLEVGRLFTSHVLSIVVSLLLGFIVWEVAKTRIDQKLREEMPEDMEDNEEGGAGGSRIGTLLLLLKKFIFSVLFVIVTMIVLSAIGVNIGPLIAGAGVVGLAIGFGSQQLVQDIISGVFFLIDDAFRLGDYIESGSAKGKVEHISMRSVKLRHPRGMLFTIPFSSIGAVKNFSRDYIITKLTIRVKYDTDIDKIRKIVKKINKKLAADPEIGPVLLDKVKSQGIRDVDESGMIVRVKFKTLPGEQFVVRREVFRMIQEEFRKNGIDFAHRNVTVYMPPGMEESGEEKAGKTRNRALEAGAAALAAEDTPQPEEEPKK